MKHAGVDFQLATRYTSFIAISSTQDGASVERIAGRGLGIEGAIPLSDSWVAL